MADFVKFALITSGSATAIYLTYKFWKNRNITEIPATNSEVGEEEVVNTCRSEERIERIDVSDSELKSEVEADGVKLWIDECVEEYYSINPGPRPLSIQRDSLTEVSDAHSPEVDVDQRSDVEKEIEWMCNYYFGVTYAEYQALEEERAKYLNERDAVNGERMAIPALQQRWTPEISNNLGNDESERDSHGFEEKGDKVKKKSPKKWKKFKKRFVKFFRGSKSE